VPHDPQRRIYKLLDEIEELSVASFRLTPDGTGAEPVLAGGSLLSWYFAVGGQRTNIVTLTELHDAVLELTGPVLARR